MKKPCRTGQQSNLKKLSKLSTVPSVYVECVEKGNFLIIETKMKFLYIWFRMYVEFYKYLEDFMKRIMIIAVLTFTIFLNYSKLSSQTVDELCKSAIESYDKKEYSASLKYFDDAIKIRPDSAQLYLLRGMLYIDLNNYDKAYEDFSSSILIDPLVGLSYYNRALIRIERNFLSGALDDLNSSIFIFSTMAKSKGINTVPELSKAYYLRGKIYVELENYGNALENFTNSILYDGKNIDAYIARADLYKSLMYYKSSIEDLEKVLEIEPKLYKTYYHLAMLKFELKDYEGGLKAIKEYKKPIAIEDSLKTAHIKLIGEWTGFYDDDSDNNDFTVKMIINKTDNNDLTGYFYWTDKNEGEATENFVYTMLSQDKIYIVSSSLEKVKNLFPSNSYYIPSEYVGTISDDKKSIEFIDNTNEIVFTLKKL